MWREHKEDLLMKMVHFINQDSQNYVWLLASCKRICQLEETSSRIILFENCKWPKHWQKEKIQLQQIEQIADFQCIYTVLVPNPTSEICLGCSQKGVIQAKPNTEHPFFHVRRMGVKLKQQRKRMGFSPPPLWKHWVVKQSLRWERSTQETSPMFLMEGSQA